ncbi:MAG TPA: methionyl-tRNA formyltransferase, partial [Oligoflexia bacterium]|nr:methionyl-tRNA formyltransferase [Oligoflexia bacterium]
MNDSATAEFPSVVFFGSPEFCVPCLEKLVQCGSYRVIAAVTQPDKPAGRGQRLTPPPVKTCALAAGLPVYQPASLKSLHLEVRNGQKFLSGEKSSTALADFLNAQAPIDIFITCAYGKILPSALLDFPQCGMINVHPSLLPRWRGAAPLQHALFAGDEKTGVSIMQVDEGLDTGPVFCRAETPIEPEET